MWGVRANTGACQPPGLWDWLLQEMSLAAFNSTFPLAKVVPFYPRGLFLLPFTPSPLHDWVVNSEISQPLQLRGAGDSHQDPGPTGPENYPFELLG